MAAEVCDHPSSHGDEGPVRALPAWRHVVRWHCDVCDQKWYSDSSLAALRELVRQQDLALVEAAAYQGELESEVARLRKWVATHA